MTEQKDSSQASELRALLMELRELSASLRKQARATEQNSVLLSQVLQAMAESEDVDLGDEAEPQYLNSR